MVSSNPRFVCGVVAELNETRDVVGADVVLLRRDGGDDVEIRQAVVFHVCGGEAVKAQANKNVTPSFSEQVVTPDPDFDYLSQVTVAAIPVTYTDNAAGGQTLQIGG